MPGWYLQGGGGASWGAGTAQGGVAGLAPAGREERDDMMGHSRELDGTCRGGFFGGGGMMGLKKVLRHIPMWKVHVLGSRMWRGVLGVRYA